MNYVLSIQVKMVRTMSKEETMSKEQASSNTSEKNQRFDELRVEIDDLDKSLVQLIAKRLQVTKEIGEIKSDLDLALYHPEREAELIDNKRAYAKSVGLEPNLIEDVIRRIIRDSYKSQNAQRTYDKNNEQKNILVVGGNGQFGQLFVDLFRKNGENVTVFEKQDSLQSKENIRNLKQADLVLISVPINVTEIVIKQLAKTLTELNPKCVLADVTSIKNKPVEEMLAQHQGPVVGLHPMFGPDIETFAKQTVAVCHGRQKSEYQWLLDLLDKKGFNLVDVEAKTHDDLMSIIQVLRHLSTVAYGNHLRHEDIDLGKILELSSPIYRLELIMVGRLFAQDPVLYSDIIFSDKNNVKMIKRFIDRISETLSFVENGDKESFIQSFNQTKEWFGEFADKFLSESHQLIAKAGDSGGGI